MAKFLDGIQQISDNISEFPVISSGTVTVGTNQYPLTPAITPNKKYSKYMLIIKNLSGQTINTIQTQINAKGIIPSASVDTFVLSANLTPMSGASSTTIPTGNHGTAGMTSGVNPFVTGQFRFQFSLGAVPTSGTIEWALIGY